MGGVVSLKTAKRRHSIGTATVQPNFSVAALAAAAGSGCLGVVLYQRVKLMCVGSSAPGPRTPKYWRLCHTVEGMRVV